jgi:eukaryotic-like serine/threonine-protein kinase
VNSPDWRNHDPEPDPNAEQVESGLIGRVVGGRYRILSRLGEGATAAVFLAEHLRIGRKDAIKILFGSVAADPEAAARFLRGARNVSAIHHPNVCTIYDFGETDEGIQFLAMEYVPGEALSAILAREGYISTDRAILITLQVADALHAAHGAGIVHRDLKPGNIMVSRSVDGSDVVKVVDFDIAKGPAGADADGDELTRAGYVIGTPEYMSPEQLTGEALDGRSDVYSLGVVLFRMLTGSLPFRSRLPQDLLVERLTKAPLPLDDVTERPFPAPLQRVLDRALARRPADRQGSAAEFARELAAAREPGPPPTIAAPSRPGRHRWSAVAAGGLVVLLGAGLVVRWLGGPAEPIPPVAGAGATTTPAVVAHSAADPPGPDVEPGEIDRPAPRAEGPPGPPAIEPPQRNPATPPAQPPPASRLEQAEVDDILWRQMDALGLPDPPLRALEAIRDTARMVWDRTDFPHSDRAFAAFILGNVHFSLGEPQACARWAERGLELRPDGPGYRTLLDTCRGAR